MANKADIDIESWEDIDGTDVFDEKLQTLVSSNRIDIENNVCFNGTNGTPINIILTGDDALRSQYVPPEPTVKILKRPIRNTLTSDGKVQQPKKTLQQREEEYAQARLRILGEAQNSDGVEEKVICSIQSKPVRCEVDSVVRLPKGPDGTKGFKIRR
ncbi:hypothetical protein PPYR_12926 [Photinus pyralis]|uniref:SUZ RNA-binding domain-containing n=1 Tax=Photinus pyralis TaxID=7054 RepID=A0A1Y1NL93_PHOPY|nr:SUZ domain-containing protein 1 [Photinus pyralis]KAB0793306.1 hypothetical protein PPYR_12926 [Photinus pyralis]